jgi:MFS family permease
MSIPLIGQGRLDRKLSKKGRFASVAAAGVAFQGGSAAVDSATIMSALVFQLTGSSIAVGAVTAILRFGWLFPQLIVGFLAQRSGSSMRYYVIGAFGRAACMAALAFVLFAGAQWSPAVLSIVVMVLWTAYAFVSGVVAVPYNDIVARSVESGLRSRLLATRFFGGGVLALGVAAVADQMVGNVAFPLSYAAIIAMAAVLMFLSSGVFVSMGEPEALEKQAENQAARPTFFQYLKDGVDVFHADSAFRLFVYAQWCGGAVLMATPFYVVQAHASGFDLERVALLLGAQTAGALASNFLWGWWGDRLGKVSLLKTIAIGRIFPPGAILLLTLTPVMDGEQALYAFVAIFFILGALANGLTIAVIGFLMEISPDDMRPAYSGYFNAITAPAFLLPFLAGVIAATFGLLVVFILSMAAAVLQSCILVLISRRLPKSV